MEPIPDMVVRPHQREHNRYLICQHFTCSQNYQTQTKRKFCNVVFMFPSQQLITMNCPTSLTPRTHTAKRTVAAYTGVQRKRRVRRACN